MTDVILETRNLKKSFGKLEVLKGISTGIRRGEVVSIIGPSGGGKSTFLRCLNLLETPDGGQVLFKGQDITDKKLNISQYRQSIGMVFQHFNVFPNLTVLENVTLAPVLEKKIPKDQAKEEAMALLEEQNLLHLKDEVAGSLPYGIQRRLEIARALATEPKLLLLDEPAAGMNPQETQELTDFIQQIRSEYNLSIFMIEHHMDLVMQISERIYVLDFGKLIAQGTPQEVQNNQRVIDAYLGVADDAED